MDLKQLRILRTIADTGSFQAAAARLNLTQPAISHQVRKLEDELGETLLLRTRPRVTLLPSSLALLRGAERIEAEMEQLSAQFGRAAGAQPSGVLRIAASTLGITYLYADLLEGFIGRHPRVELILTATESGVGGTRHVLSGQCDIALSPLPVEHAFLVATPLATARHVCIVSRGHALSARRRVSAADLMQQPFIRYQQDAGSRSVSDALFASRDGSPPVALESNDTEFIKRMVALGLGVAIVPSFTVSDQGDRERLVQIPIAGVDVRQEFGLVTRRDVSSRVTLLFKEYCVENAHAIGGSRVTHQLKTTKLNARRPDPVLPAHRRNPRRH